jgi:transposase
VQRGWYDRKRRRVRDLACGDLRIYLDLEVRRVACRRCGKVRQERLEWLADNPFYSKRFAFYVGRRCRASPIRDVAKELHLDWHTVKALEQQYMREQLRRVGTPGPRDAGPPGHRDRRGLEPQGAYLPDRGQRPHPAAADLVRRHGSLRGQPGSVLRLARPAQSRPGAARGHGHVEALPAVDHAPRPAGRRPVRQFHVLRHLGEALDQVRKSEYARVSGRQRRFIKGQKYTLLAHRENLTLDGRRALKTLLAANKRLNTAYLLKESFGQLWDYGREGWARRFFEHWRAALRWQRLRPYERFAAMIDRHWDGIAAYCRPDNKVALGFVEGVNNKVRVLQRRAYGLRDEEYLRLKILTCMLPAI